jgi:hypothetical protein
MEVHAAMQSWWGMQQKLGEGTALHQLSQVSFAADTRLVHAPSPPPFDSASAQMQRGELELGRCG